MKIMNQVTRALMLATTVGSVMAAEQAMAPMDKKIAKGFYVGLSAGGAATVADYKANSVGATTQNDAVNIKSNYGIFGGLFGGVVGYNWQMNNFVFGAELDGGFDTTKKDVFDNTTSGDQVAGYFGKLNIKRSSYFGIAPRIGFMVSCCTLMYAKLGTQYSKWQAQWTPDASWVNAHPVSASSAATSASPVKTNKGTWNFAPGLGIEIFKNKMFVRGEYSYVFGSNIKLTHNTAGILPGNFDGSAMLHQIKPTQHQFKLVVGYKF